ncbi:MAG: hypothetical protein U0795_08230 [Pirellulales bacterium]
MTTLLRHRTFGTLRLTAALALALTTNGLCAGEFIETFDAPGVVPYSLSNSLGTAPAIVAGGPSGNFLRLVTTGVASDNAISFDETPLTSGPAPKGKILSFDFRLMGGTMPVGEGMASGHFTTAAHGATGPRNPGFLDPVKDWEKASFAGSVNISFDVSPNADKVNLNAFGTTIAEVDVSSMIDLNDGVFHHAILGVFPDPADNTKALIDVDIIEDVYGAATKHAVLVDFPAAINMNTLPGNRMMAGARTSADAQMTVDLDNLHVSVVPEPGMAGIALISTLGLILSRRRARQNLAD